MNNIKELRDQVGKTQSDLAAELGITQGAVAHYEKSRRKPGLDTCRKIAKTHQNNHESEAGSLPPF